MSKTTLAGTIKIAILVLGTIAQFMFGLNPLPSGGYALGPDASWIAAVVVFLYGILSWIQAKLSADANPTE